AGRPRHPAPPPRLGLPMSSGASPAAVPSRLRRVFRAAGRAYETGWVFSIAYLIWAHLHHEFWRDEIHSWSIARGADSFADILTGDRVYEGHPPLWFWYLRVWSLFVRSAV